MWGENKASFSVFKFSKKNYVCMTSKDWKFWDEILKAVAILDSLSSFQNNFHFNSPLGCGFPTIINLLNSFKY